MERIDDTTGYWAFDAFQDELGVEHILEEITEAQCKPCDAEDCDNCVSFTINQEITDQIYDELLLEAKARAREWVEAQPLWADLSSENEKMLRRGEDVHKHGMDD